MSAKEPELLKKFLLELIVDLKTNVFVDNRDAQYDLRMIELAFKKMSMLQLMEKVCPHILRFEKEILAGNKEAVYRNKSIFQELPPDRVDFYANYFMNDVPPDVEANVMEYFKIFLKLCKRFKKDP